MIKLGIIGAMETEIELLLEHLEDEKKTEAAGSTFYEGTLQGLPVAIVQCGVGKVNAAICTQVLCDRFGVTHLMNTGAGGSLCNDLEIGDFVVSQDAIYHDVNCTQFGYAMLQVPGMNVVSFPADEQLIAFAFAAAEKDNPGHTKIGRIASGDQFISEVEKKNQIAEITRAVCTEMEGAAIAHTAYRNRVPFVILRAISDKADGGLGMDYQTFEDIAAHRSARVTMMMAAALHEEEEL